jgi:hypothetical protein
MRTVLPPPNADEQLEYQLQPWQQYWVFDFPSRYVLRSPIFTLFEFVVNPLRWFYLESLSYSTLGVELGFFELTIRVRLSLCQQENHTHLAPWPAPFLPKSARPWPASASPK